MVLPEEILDYFDIVKIETDESDIDAMSMTIHLDERMNAYLQKSEEYESKGFMEPVRVTDFPIRDHKVILVLRRRRWKNLETGETFVDRMVALSPFSHLTHRRSLRRTGIFPPLPSRETLNTCPGALTTLCRTMSWT